MLKKSGGNWVSGDRFFDREEDLARLREEVCEGTHIHLTAQRRMGKTSLVRELLTRLESEEGVRTAFVDLEAARDPADAIVEISMATKNLRESWRRGAKWAAHPFRRLTEVGVRTGAADLKFRLRAETNQGNWKRKGDRLLEELVNRRGLVVLALDELPLLVNRILRGSTEPLQPERVDAADEFLSWLRRSAQAHRDRLRLIVSGSVGIAPILKRAGLSATMNAFSTFDLKPWDLETAEACLQALAETYRRDVPTQIWEAACLRLRSCVPHHVQQFFDALDRQLAIARRAQAKFEDAERAYVEDMLGPRGQIDMDHYDSRLKLVLGNAGYPVALEPLARTATERVLERKSIADLRNELVATDDTGADLVPYVLEVLQHDGYFVRTGSGFRFASGLMEDWHRRKRGHPIERLGEALRPGR